MLKLLFILIFYVCASKAIVYDAYYGNLRPLTRSQIREYEIRNNTKYCTVNVRPCDRNEWKRLDGSCNNLRYPSLGTKPAGTIRVLRPRFSPTDEHSFTINANWPITNLLSSFTEYEPAKLKSGRDYPLARFLRTNILETGKASDLKITQFVSHYVLFMLSDVNSIHDVLNYILNNTKCCTPEGKNDYTCTPNYMPADDPVHRFSGVKCMNLTRPQTFQSWECLPEGTTFTRIQFATQVYDLGHLYNYMPGAIENQRTYKNGLLKVEVENGHIFPPSTGKGDPMGMKNADYSNPCGLNQPPVETRCHKYIANGEMATSVFNILFHRLHNVIARRLRQMNPCWDDNRLFYTARDITIAVSLNIFYYEMLPVALGKDNMIRDGVILPDGELFRDRYDENEFPLVTDEYVYVLRYFHTIQETTLKLYDKYGHFLNTFPIVNCTTRTGLLPIDNFISKFLASGYRQEGGRFDFTMDFDAADRILGGLHFAADVGTSDLAKGRFFGLQPYIRYREFCSRKNWTFDDLRQVMSDERVYRLSQVYESVEDVELMAGIWAEEQHPGSRVPYTAYCLIVDQLIRSMVSDRHWYERPNRPHAFTEDQLRAVRNVTLAGLLCTVGDDVIEVQPQAFYTKSADNPILPCSSTRIGHLNLAPWRDPTCRRSNY